MVRMTAVFALKKPCDLRLFSRLAMVEITAKVFHGYNAGEAYKGIDENELKKTKGREYGYDRKEAATDDS